MSAFRNRRNVKLHKNAGKTGHLRNHRFYDGERGVLRSSNWITRQGQHAGTCHPDVLCAGRTYGLRLLQGDRVQDERLETAWCHSFVSVFYSLSCAFWAWSQYMNRVEVLFRHPKQHHKVRNQYTQSLKSKLCVNWDHVQQFFDEIRNQFK